MDGLLLDESKKGSVSEALLQQSWMERQTPTEWADQWLSTPLRQCEWDETGAGCKTRSGPRIGSRDVMGFGCWGRTIAAAYSAPSARHSICGM